jgi:hypothetical protein
MQHTGIGEEADPCLLRRGDHRAMLRPAAGEVVGGDQQHTADPRHRRLQTVRPVVIANPQFHTLRHKVRASRFRADECDDARRRHGRKKFADHEAAKRAARASHQQSGKSVGHHCFPLWSQNETDL